MIAAVCTRRAAAVALIALFAICVTGPAEAVRRRDKENPILNAPEDEKFVEQQATPPAYPKDSDLREFALRGQTTNRFFIDTSTLTVGKDRIVRFVMLIRSPANETNVRFAALRCKTREWKDYAFGRDDHTWAVDEDPEWRNIQMINLNNYQRTLYQDYFCSGGILTSEPAGDSQKLVKLLKNPPRPDPRVPRSE
ncbi:MAG: CNP1-like family protein [Betaproteobacteria bacterium]